MAHQKRKWVIYCAYLLTENRARLSDLGLINMLDSEYPFRIIFMYVWYLGKIMNKRGDKKILRNM